MPGKHNFILLLPDKITMNKELFCNFSIIFLVTNILGLVAGQALIRDGIRATIINDNPQGIENGLGIIVWILVFTGILLLLLKYGPPWLTYAILKLLESIAVFGSALIVISPFTTSETTAFGFATGIIALRIFLRKSLLLKNIATAIAAAGAGSLIGASLGITPIAVFVALLAAYDYVAVFKTKHMVTLAEGIAGKNLAFTFAIPTNEKKFELGTGDIVVPLAFAVSVLGEAMKTNPPAAPYAAGVILLASILGLMITLDLAAKKKQPLPALPLQAVYMLFAFAVMKITILG